MKKVLLVSLLMVAAIHPGRDRKPEAKSAFYNFGKMCLLALIGSVGNAFSADTCDAVKGCPAPPFHVDASRAPKNHFQKPSGFILMLEDDDSLMEEWGEKGSANTLGSGLSRFAKRTKRKNKKRGG